MKSSSSFTWKRTKGRIHRENCSVKNLPLFFFWSPFLNNSPDVILIGLSFFRFRHNLMDLFHGLWYPIFFLGQHDFRDLFLIRPMHWCFECISVIQCCYVLSKSRFSKVAAPPGKAIFGYLVFHAHSAPHYFLFFVISEPRKQFKPHINNGSHSLLFYFQFLGSRWHVAFTQGLRRWGRNGFRLRMIGMFTDTYTSAFISSQIFLKSFESCQKSLSLLNFRLFFGWHRSHCRRTRAADDR